MRRPELSGGPAAGPTMRQLVEAHGGVLFDLGADGGPRPARPGDAVLGHVPTGVRLQSARIRHGELFAGLRGLARDGARYLPDAFQHGAAAGICTPERSVSRLAARLAGRGLDLRARGLWLHPRPSDVVAAVAADVYGRPAEALSLAAVTGTNGKTSVCHLAGQLLARADLSPAVLGTAGHSLQSPRGPLRLESTHTTPDVAELQRLLSRHVGGGGRTAVMEASSHGLLQGRMAGLGLRVAAFTNLTREHLDYHGTMERYLDAKARLWDLLLPGAGVAVVFGRTEASLEMRRRALARGARLVVVDIGGAGDLTARDVTRTAEGWRFDIVGLGMRAARVDLPLAGEHNVENALVAAAIARSLGASASAVVEGLRSALAPPGRLERVVAPGSGGGGVAGDRGVDVLVDYAHSPDAMERVLAELRRGLDGDARGGRLICVFGCGGDRDRGKRVPMGRASGRLADVTVVTSDNPRGEDPAGIAETVLEGVDAEGGHRFLELDRGRAIERAVAMARPGDVVLIAGKGHENTQVIQGRAVPFDDRVVAAEALARAANPGGEL